MPKTRISLIKQLRIILIAIPVVYSSRLSAQSEYLPMHVGIAASYSGFKNNMLGIGISFQPWDVRGDYVEYPFAGFTIMHEIEPTRKLYCNSFNFYYLSGPFSCGLGVNRTSDFVNETWGIKPMIGISIARISILYGYTIFLMPNEIPEFYHPSFNLGYTLPLLKAKPQERSYDLPY